MLQNFLTSHEGLTVTINIYVSVNKCQIPEVALKLSILDERNIFQVPFVILLQYFSVIHNSLAILIIMGLDCVNVTYITCFTI